MKQLTFFFTCFLFFNYSGYTQLLPDSSARSIWATSLHSHKFGTSQTYGQLPVYFPKNVLGPVPPDATPEAPAYKQEDVVSIGKGGFIALGFNPPILNGPGADLTVFENVMKVGNGFFGEWMIVSASIDGATWYTFPYDSVSGKGLAGHLPTFGNASNFRDPAKSGGDPFDLSVIGLDSAKYIKVTDATHFMEANGCSGCASADLDAIVAIYQVGDPVDTIPPDIPIRLTASAGDAKADLSWETEETVKVTYKVFADTVSNPQKLIAMTAETHLTADSLINGNMYYFRVKAVDSLGNESNFSDEAQARPEALVPQSVAGTSRRTDIQYTYLDGQLVLTSALPISKVIIYDVNGRVVHADKPQSTYLATTLPKGIYLVQVDSGKVINNLKVLLNE